jgi:hypothetical protein
MALDEVATEKGQIFQVGIVADRYPMGKYKGSTKYVPVYDERAIEYVAGLIRERVQDKFDCVILITGERRTGKSTLSIQLAKAVSKMFDIRHLAFRLEDFNRVIAENPYADPSKGIYPQVNLDESGFDLFSQNWMDRMQRNLVRKFEVIGAKCQVVYLVLPHRMLLNRGLREGMAHFWINVTTFESMRGLAELREAQGSIWQLEAYWRPLCAFTFKPEAGPMWDEYTKRKFAFIDEVCAAQESDAPSRASQLIHQRNEAIRMCYRPGEVSYQQIADRLGVSKQAIIKVVQPGLE